MRRVVSRYAVDLRAAPLTRAAGSCVGVTKKMAAAIASYTCPQCAASGGGGGGGGGAGGGDGGAAAGGDGGGGGDGDNAQTPGGRRRRPKKAVDV